MTYPANMEAKNLGYSLKSIPIPTKQHYLKSMIDKVESFITIRQKAYFFKKPDQRNSNNPTYFGNCNWIECGFTPKRVRDMTRAYS